MERGLTPQHLEELEEAVRNFSDMATEPARGPHYWLHVLFAGYQDLDDAGEAPKDFYIVAHAVETLENPEHPLFMAEKLERLRHIDVGQPASSNLADLLRWLNTLSKSEMIAVGV